MTHIDATIHTRREILCLCMQDFFSIYSIPLEPISIRLDMEHFPKFIKIFFFFSESLCFFGFQSQDLGILK